MIDKTIEPFTITNERYGICIDVNKEAIDEARKLIDEGWFQTSNKHRQVARFPRRTTGVLSLAKAQGAPPHTIAKRWTEESAGDFYLRVHAKPKDKKQLSPAVWAAYKKLGGGTYHRYAPKGFKGKRLHDVEMSLQVVMEAALELWSRDPDWFRSEVVTDREQFVDLLEQLELPKNARNARTYAKIYGYPSASEVYDRWKREPDSAKDLA